MVIFNYAYDCKLDAKGRLVLPAKIKAGLPDTPSNELILRRALDPCLELYTMQEAIKKYNLLAEIDEADEEGMMFKRSYFSKEVPVELDATGRFLIPKSMLLHAHIDKEAKIIGMGKRIEIWNPEIYAEHLIKTEEKYRELSKKYISNKND